MKTILITGSTDGIGKETAKQLAKKGHRIIIHGRNQDKALNVKKELNSINPEAGHKIAIANLQSQKQVLDLIVKLKEEEDKIDILINNAGTYRNSLEYTEDQIEKTIAVNYHSHFILTLLLIPLLKKSSDPRIINFSSMIHSHTLNIDKIWDPDVFNSSQAYSDSKLAIILFTFKLDKLLNDISVNCLHPGVINTKLLKKGWGAGGSSVKKGAETPVYLALSDEIKEESGYYFINKSKKKPVDSAFSQELQNHLWNKSIKMIRYQEILNKIDEYFLDSI